MLVLLSDLCSTGISVDCIPPFRFSLDYYFGLPTYYFGHLLEINKIILSDFFSAFSPLLNLTQSIFALVHSCTHVAFMTAIEFDFTPSDITWL